MSCINAHDASRRIDTSFTHPAEQSPNGRTPITRLNPASTAGAIKPTFPSRNRAIRRMSSKLARVVCPNAASISLRHGAIVRKGCAITRRDPRKIPDPRAPTPSPRRTLQRQGVRKMRLRAKAQRPAAIKRLNGASIELGCAQKRLRSTRADSAAVVVHDRATPEHSHVDPCNADYLPPHPPCKSHHEPGSSLHPAGTP
jgi:hypothetical protein